MSPFNKTVVLVADDEPSTRTLVSNHLRNRGYEVLEATDGDEAWSLAQEHLPDLIVLDVMMPGMSGWEVCRRLRETVALAHTGVLMLTGIGESLNEMTSPLYGADAYLDKPFEFRELDEQLATTLERRRGGAFGRPDGADVDDGSAEDLSDLAPSEPAPLVAGRQTVRSGGTSDDADEPAPESAARPAKVRRQRAAPVPVNVAGSASKRAAPVEPGTTQAAKKAAPKAVKKAAKKAAPKAAKKAAPKAPKKTAKKAAPKAVKKAAPKTAKKAVKKAAPKAAKKAAPKTAKKAAPKAARKAAPKAAKKAAPKAAKKAVKKAAPKIAKKAAPRAAKKAAGKRVTRPAKKVTRKPVKRGR